MSDSYNVGDLVAEVLHASGVTNAFGVIAMQNLPVLDAIGRRNNIRFVMARGEMGAGHMADACARISGKPSALITCGGGGAANAASAMAEARLAFSPVIHITAQIPTAHIDRSHGVSGEIWDQLDMLKSVSKAAFRVRTPQSAYGTLMQAVTEALRPPRGPVSIEIPLDIQRAAVARPPMHSEVSISVAPLDSRQLDNLVEIVATARRPLLWLGNGARDAGAGAAKLLDLGFGAAASYSGRGIISDEDPRSLGAFTGRQMPIVERFYESIDLLLVVGSRLRAYETQHLALKLPKRIVQIDIDPLANGRTYASESFLCADAAIALEALSARLKGRIKVDPQFQKDVADFKRQVIATFTAGLGPYATCAEQLRAVMPRDAIWIRDVTANGGTWGSRLFPVYGPRDAAFSVSGALGLGLPFAIGAAVAGGGRKVVAICGDGGFAMNIGELWTALQEKADVTFIVMNDGGYGVINDIQDQTYGGRHFYTDLLMPDFEKLAHLTGMPFRRVEKIDTFGKAVGEVLAEAGPGLVEVDMTKIGRVPAVPR